MKKSLKVLFVILSLGLIFSLKAENSANVDNQIEQVAKSDKPFTMVVNDNVIVVEKFKLLSSEVEAEATVQEESEEQVSAVMSLDQLYDFTINYYNRHKEPLKGLIVKLCLSVIVIILGIIIGKAIKSVVRNRCGSSKSPNLISIIIRDIAMPVLIIFAALFVYLSFSHVQNLGVFYICVSKFAVAVLSCAMIWVVFSALDAVATFIKVNRQYQNRNFKLILVDVTNTITKTVLGTVLALFLLQNVFGLNINTLLTSAGIAGLAIAFAAQNSIANFISSLMLIMDHPFNIGDRIVTNGIDGLVESIGFRSTKVRSLDGHLHYIPNNNMANVDIENIALRKSIKDVATLTLTYDTKPEEIERAFEILHEILDGHEMFTEIEPPIINFVEFNSFSLDIQVITWFATEDYFAYLAAKTKINLEILRRFNAENLNFAYPTNTTYLAGAISTLNEAKK